MPIKKKDIELKNQKIVSLTISVLLFFSPFALFVNLITVLIFRKFVSFDSVILYSILLFFLLWSLTISFRRIKLTTIGIPAFLLLAYFISYAVYPELRVYMFTSWMDLSGNNTYWLFINALPAFLLIRQIWNYEILMKYLRGFSIATVLASLGTLIIYLSLDEQPAYMYFSYDMLLAVILLLFSFFQGKKTIILLMAILGAGQMFFCGARGPMLCVGLAIVLYVLFLTDKPTAKILTILFAALFLLLAFVFWEPLLNVLANISESLGIESRMIEKMRDGTLADSSGRDSVRSELTPYLSLWGRGIYGDRGLTEGRHAHNFFLEVMVHYGLIIGSVICIFIVFLLLAGFFTKDREKKLLFIAFFCSGIVKLMMSSSYVLKEPAFYAMLGICVSCYYKDDVVPKETKERPKIIPVIKLKNQRKRYY